MINLTKDMLTGAIKLAKIDIDMVDKYGLGDTNQVCRVAERGTDFQELSYFGWEIPFELKEEANSILDTDDDLRVKILRSIIPNFDGLCKKAEYDAPDPRALQVAANLGILSVQKVSEYIESEDEIRRTTYAEESLELGTRIRKLHEYYIEFMENCLKQCD